MYDIYIWYIYICIYIYDIYICMIYIYIYISHIYIIHTYVMFIYIYHTHIYIYHIYIYHIWYIYIYHIWYIYHICIYLIYTYMFNICIWYGQYPDTICTNMKYELYHRILPIQGIKSNGPLFTAILFWLLQVSHDSNWGLPCQSLRFLSRFAPNMH